MNVNETCVNETGTIVYVLTFYLLVSICQRQTTEFPFDGLIKYCCIVCND